jgi:hypothetical protein
MAISKMILMKFALVFLIPAVVLFGQVTPKTNPRVVAAPTFACDQKTLGPRFAGANIESIVKRVKALASAQPKSEFETTAQYQKRIQGDGEELAFVIPTYSDDQPVHGLGSWFQYDADAAAMTMQVVHGSEATMSDDGWVQSFDLTSQSSYGRDYIGMNGFGATTTVTPKKETIYGLSWVLTIKPGGGFEAVQYKEVAEIMKGDILGTTKITIPMTPTEARVMKPFLKMAIFAQNRPHIFKTKDYHGATLDYPYEVETTGYYLDVTVEHLVVFDSRTGKILKTVPECEPEPALTPGQKSEVESFANSLTQGQVEGIESRVRARCSTLWNLPDMTPDEVSEWKACRKLGF